MAVERLITLTLAAVSLLAGSDPTFALRPIERAEDNAGLEELEDALGAPRVLHTGLEEKLGSFAEFEKWHNAHHVKVAADAAQGTYFGDALWHLWRGIEALLRQKMKKSAVPWAGKHTADLAKLLEQDLNRLMEAYRAHYAELQWTVKVIKPDVPLPTGVELWSDPFGAPLTEEQVSTLEAGNRIFLILHLVPPPQKEEKNAGIVFETPASLLRRAEANWNILGISSRTPDGPSRTQHLHALKAKVFGGTEAQRALQPLRSRELTQRGFQPPAPGRPGADARLVPAAAAPLKEQLIYADTDQDPFLNHLRFVRRRLAHLPKRDTFSPEEVLTLLTKHYTQVDQHGKPLETEPQAQERIQRVLEGAKKISPKEPFASKGDAETLVDEIGFAIGLAPYKELEPIPAARELVKRVDRNEPAGSRLATVILWLVEEFKKPKGERDRAKLTAAVWAKFSGRVTAAPVKPDKGPPAKGPPGASSSAEIKLPPPPEKPGQGGPGPSTTGLEERLSLAQIYRRMRPLVLKPEHRVIALDVNGVLTPDGGAMSDATREMLARTLSRDPTLEVLLLSFGEPARVQEMVLDRLDPWRRHRISVITLSRERRDSKGAALQQWLRARGIAPTASLFAADSLENLEGFPGLADWTGTAVYLGAYQPDLPANVVQFGLAGDGKPQEGEQIARLILALEMAKRELPRDLLETARFAVRRDDWIGFREPVEFLLDRMHLAPKQALPDRPALLDRTARELAPGIFLVPGSVLNGIFSASPYGSVSAMTNLPPWARPDQPGLTPEEAWNQLIRWDPDLQWLNENERAELLWRLMTLDHTLLTPAATTTASELRHVLEHERFHGLIFSKPGQPKLLEDGFAELKAANRVVVRLFEANSSVKTWEEFWPSWFRVPVDDPELQAIWNLARDSVRERIRDKQLNLAAADAVDLADSLGSQAVAEVGAVLPQVHAALGLPPPARPEPVEARTSLAGLEEGWIFGPMASNELPDFIMDAMHNLALQPEVKDLQEIILLGSMPGSPMFFQVDANQAAQRSPNFEELRSEVVQALRDGGVRFRKDEGWLITYLGPTKIRFEWMGGEGDEEETHTEMQGFGIALTPFAPEVLETEVPEPAQWQTSGERLTAYLGRLLSAYSSLKGPTAIRIVLPDGQTRTELIPPVQYQQAVYNLLIDLAKSLGDLMLEIAHDVVREREVSVDPGIGLRIVTLTLDDGDVDEGWDAAGPSTELGAGLEEAPSVREVLLVGRRYAPPPVEWSSVAGKRGIRLSVATNLAQAKLELKGIRRRSLFGVTYGVVIHRDVALASEVKAFIRDEINPDGRNPSETVPVTLLFSWVPEGPELAEIVVLKDQGQINEYGGGGDGTAWSEAGVEGILRGISQVVQKDLQRAKESRPKIELDAGLEERVDLEGALQRVRQGIGRKEFWFLALYHYDRLGWLAELSGASPEALESELQPNNELPGLRRDLQLLLEQADDRMSLVLTKDPLGRAFYIMPARNRPEEERLRDEARVLLDTIAVDLAIAWDSETLQGTSEWDFPASTGLLQPYGGVFGISWEEFYAMLKKQRPFPILRPASDLVPLDRLIWWVEGEQASPVETEKGRNRPLQETQLQAQLLWLAALDLLNHLAAQGPEAPVPEDLLQDWMEARKEKATISEPQARSFVDRTRVLFSEVVESLRQRPSATAGPSTLAQTGLEEGTIQVSTEALGRVAALLAARVTWRWHRGFIHDEAGGRIQDVRVMVHQHGAERGSVQFRVRTREGELFLTDLHPGLPAGHRMASALLGLLLTLDNRWAGYTLDVAGSSGPVEAALHWLRRHWGFELIEEHWDSDQEGFQATYRIPRVAQQPLKFMLGAGLEELPATAAEWMPTQGEAVPRASAQRSAVGYVVDAGVGVIRSRLELNTPYLVVAEGLEQVRLLQEMEVPAARIVALVEDQAQKEQLVAEGFPGDNALTAEGFSEWSDARRYAWRVASDWLGELDHVEVTALRTSARTVLGLLAQMKELLPLGWQRDDMLTAETAEQILLLYQLGA